MCLNLNQMLHSNVPQHEINVSVYFGAPYIMTVYFEKDENFYVSAMFYENKWPESLQWFTPTDGEQKSEPDTYCFAKDMMSPCQKVLLSQPLHMTHK